MDAHDPTEDNKVFDDIIQRELFFERIACGIHPVNAGIEAGWSPAQTKKKMAEPEFKELCEAALQRADASIEEALYAIASRGNLGAIQMWLYNRQPDRWRDVKRIEVRNDVTVSLGVVESVKRGAIELLREQGVGAMQAIGPVVEAEASE